MFDHLLGKKNFSIERLVTLCQVAEAGSIGAAAGSSASQQSQYSRQIAELESFLGIDLLDRHSKPYRVSPQGLRLTGICRNYLSVLDDFVANCKGHRSKLVVGSGESSIQWLLIPGVLPRLHKEMPEVSVIFRNLQSEAIEALQNGEIDFGFVRRSAVPKSLKTVGKWTLEYSLFVPKKLGGKLKSPVTLDQLVTLPFATLEGRGQFRMRLSELARSAGADLNFTMECSSFTQVALLVEREECCAVLPSFARSQLDKSKIVRHPLKGFKALERTLCFAFNPRRSEIRPMIGEAAAVMSR